MAESKPDRVPIRLWLQEFLDRQPQAADRFAHDPGYHFGVHVVVDTLLAVDDRMRALGFALDVRVMVLQQTFVLLFEARERFQEQARTVSASPSTDVLREAFGLRRAARAAKEVDDPAGCTSREARWCPVHGQCTCPPVDGDPGRGRTYDGADCRLHAEGSGHPAPKEEGAQP